MLLPLQLEQLHIVLLLAAEHRRRCVSDLAQAAEPDMSLRAVHGCGASFALSLLIQPSSTSLRRSDDEPMATKEWRCSRCSPLVGALVRRCEVDAHALDERCSFALLGAAHSVELARKKGAACRA